ncbi:MAG: hypothetical protein QOF51_3039 [Chloroflexota bacterium]|jgi:uncharacterized protein (DUF433 family)|nr:hypothetical protein [Chloroflexota bacterium]
MEQRIHMSEIMAFSAEHVCKLTGLSDRQLRYWDETGFFRPQFAEELRHRPFGRIYSFRDVVNLRVVALLRNQHGVPLQELRVVGARLAECPERTWATLTLYAVGKAVFFDDPRTGARTSAKHPKQIVLPIAMTEIASEMQLASEQLRQRKPEEIGRIQQNRYVAHNAPVLSGTRVPTTAVWNFYHAGYTTAAIIHEFPRLTAEDVAAAIEYEGQRQQKRAG